MLPRQLQLKHFCNILSNCMMSKRHAITKVCRCAELIDTLNTCWKRLIMVIIMLCYSEDVTSYQGSMRTFSKHYSKCEMVSIKFRKTLQERRLPILNVHRIIHKTIFWTFDFKKCFHNFTKFRGYPWNIFETDICGTFLECSGNTTSWLLKFAKRSTFVIIKSYTFNIKTNFPSRVF